MTRSLSDARAALALATTQYLEACDVLCSPLKTASNETNRLYINEVAESAENFIGSIRDKLSDTVIVLKRARNRHVHIHWIPPEILVKIMLLDLEVHETPGLENPIASRASRAISLSSVCSHWRELAIQTGSFWSRILFSFSTSLVTAFIQRAWDRPLEVTMIEPPIELTYYSYQYELWRSQSVVKDHIDKIGSLNLSVYNLAKIGVITDWVSRFSPPCCLQELSLGYTGERWSDIFQEPYFPSPPTTLELDSIAN
ncbi:unnamed protein product [Rhizoctonia solani]|uniref:F-box domain-containing protein n=1 Tax=Rhizoctonia solani TaxID=456999 RepID=A0A8H2XDJ8_9AGAM|nr:unnamed protein product [Rhizoctonia solani]